MNDFLMPYSIQFTYPDGSAAPRPLIIPDPAQRNATDGDNLVGHRLYPGTYTLQWTFNGPERLRMDVRMNNGAWIFRETMPAGDASRSEMRSIHWTVPTRSHTIRFYPPDGFSEASRTRGYGASLMVIPMAGFQAGGG